MSDLIDREDAIHAIYHHLPTSGEAGAAMMLHEVQSVDAVEVVRCEDCAIRYTSCPMVVRSGSVFTFLTEDDDYCSYGVAKGERDG